ncbi:unnamed protein product [Rotaria sp. Silwood2]|nr:unnamed protein product [Rotaria sp. Silwood2]
MPRNQNTERFVVVRADIDGNILDYDIVEQPIISYPAQRTAQLYRSKSIEPTSRVNRTQNNNYGEGKNKHISVNNESLKTAYSDPSTRTPPIRRRVRYVPPTPTVKIFQQKVNWHAEPKIRSHNDEAIRQIRRAPKRKIFAQKLSWNTESKLNTHNEEAIETIRHRTRSQIFEEKPNWNVETKIDSHNEQVVESLRQAPKPRIYDEKINWKANTKLDTHNEQIVQYLKSAPKSTIYDEKLTWPSSTRIDHHNEEYVQNLERERTIREQTAKLRVQSLSHEHTVKADKPRIDHYNSDYVEHKKRRKSARLPPIEDRKLEWKKESRISQRNDDYIGSIQQKRSVPLIFREKVQWKTKSPRINAHNEEYLDNLKDQKRPRIVNQLPPWSSQSKIDSYNDSYDQNSNSRLKPVVNMLTK